MRLKPPPLSQLAVEEALVVDAFSYNGGAPLELPVKTCPEVHAVMFRPALDAEVVGGVLAYQLFPPSSRLSEKPLSVGEGACRTLHRCERWSFRFVTEFVLHGRTDDERVARIHNLLLCFCRVGICRLVYGTLPDMRSPGTVCRALFRDGDDILRRLVAYCAVKGIAGADLGIG